MVPSLGNGLDYGRVLAQALDLVDDETFDFSSPDGLRGAGTPAFFLRPRTHVIAIAFAAVAGVRGDHGAATGDTANPAFE